MDAVRSTIMPPNNDLDSGIAPVEVLRDTIGGKDVIRIRMVPEEGDLDRLAAGEPLWLTWYSSVLVPFSVAFADIVVPEPGALRLHGCSCGQGDRSQVHLTDCEGRLEQWDGDEWREGWQPHG